MLHSVEMCRVNWTPGPSEVLKLDTLFITSSLENQLCFTSLLRKLWRILLGNFRSALHTLFIASSPITQSCQTPLITSTCLLSCSTSGSWRWWRASDTGTLSAFPSPISCRGRFFSCVYHPQNHTDVIVGGPSDCFSGISSIVCSFTMSKQNALGNHDYYKNLYKKLLNLLRTVTWKQFS